MKPTSAPGGAAAMIAALRRASSSSGYCASTTIIRFVLDAEACSFMGGASQLVAVAQRMHGAPGRQFARDRHPVGNRRDRDEDLVSCHALSLEALEPVLAALVVLADRQIGPLPLLDAPR
ncbi:MAG: hypothetical protein GEU81_02495 [Nitriliruptorales bacterium]|nr:hypothetical protein [Nitriliruptorales bacterium]